MSVQIKSVSGRVLYTAEHAADVRAALQEAVKERAYLGGADLGGANLGGANLRGADLGGANLRGANLRGANLGGANLRDAYLRGADLGGAYLRGANLGGAYLRGANLRGADLGGANLRGANLGGADLGDARGVNPYLTTPLHILADQPGPARAYKLVNAAGEGPQYGGIVYRQGETVEAEADHDPEVDCGKGLNIATLDWCMKHWRKGYRILLVEFDPADIAAIPHGSDGKFRVTKLTVVGEKDLVELGLVEAVTA